MFNDIATARAACLSGTGWALLPHYAVTDEIKKKQLVIIDQQTKALPKYGVWWLRNRKIKKELTEKLCIWLNEQEL